jgi:hypothetical protein
MPAQNLRTQPLQLLAQPIQRTHVARLPLKLCLKCGCRPMRRQPAQPDYQQAAPSESAKGGLAPGY